MEQRLARANKLVENVGAEMRRANPVATAERIKFQSLLNDAMAAIGRAITMAEEGSVKQGGAK